MREGWEERSFTVKEGRVDCWIESLHDGGRRKGMQKGLHMVTTLLTRINNHLLHPKPNHDLAFFSNCISIYHILIQNIYQIKPSSRSINSSSLGIELLPNTIKTTKISSWTQTNLSITWMLKLRPIEITKTYSFVNVHVRLLRITPSRIPSQYVEVWEHLLIWKKKNKKLPIKSTYPKLSKKIKHKFDKKK